MDVQGTAFNDSSKWANSSPLGSETVLFSSGESFADREEKSIKAFYNVD